MSDAVSILRRLRALGLALAALLALGLPAGAEMAEALRREFHPMEELGVAIVTDSSLREADRLLKDPALKVLVLQVRPENLEESQAARLLDWVRAGHTLWFYDARMAGLFGMRPYMLRSEQFRGRPEEGVLGDHKYQGLATTTMALGSHEVLAGVGQCTIFLPELEKDSYGAVAVEGDTVALLQFAHDSPALAALRRDGRGLIVFKPVLWTKPLSGERFQGNLLEYSAGFGVPGPGGSDRIGNPPGPQAAYVEGSPAVPPAGSGSRVLASPMPPVLASPAPSPSPVVAPSPSPSPRSAVRFPDRVEVVGEGVFQGRVLTPSFRFETSGESLRVLRDEIALLVVRSPSQLDRIELRDGRALSGFLMDGEVQVELPDGVRTLGKRQFVRIEFAPAP